MGTDTRIAVIVFLFYLLNGLTSLVTDRIFLPPLFAEAWLLGGVSVIYFLLSIPSAFSLVFALMGFYCFYGVYNPILPQQHPDILQQITLWIPFALPVVLYTFTLLKFKKESKRGKIMWTIHMLCFIISLVPVWFNHTEMVSLAAGIIQAFTGIVMLSNDDIELLSTNWQKKIVLLMILIVFFDVSSYIYFMSLPSA